jgi:hypothetical protein
MAKKCILLFFLITTFTFQIRAQDQKENKDLSFLKGQKNIKLEFSFNNIIINDDSEQVFLDKEAAKIDKKDHGTSADMLIEWDAQKNDKAPRMFAAGFHNIFSDAGIDFDGVTDLPFEPPYYDLTAKPPVVKTQPKYVCVITVLSIKTGVGKVVTPTLWIQYTFYEINKRDVVLAQFKSHLDYGRDQTIYDNRGNVKHATQGSWTGINDPYFEAGKIVAKQVRKAIK